MSTTENNKVHYDLTNVHMAPMNATGENPTWGDFHRVHGAISVDLAAQGDTVKLRADGIDYYVSKSNNGYEGDLNLAMITDWIRINVLGETLSAADKVLVENSMKEGQPFAMAFEFLGDKKNRRHLLYNLVAGRPNIKGENKDNPRDPDTETLSITASPLADGSVKASTTEDTPEDVYANWFKGVWHGDGSLNAAEAAEVSDPDTEQPAASGEETTEQTGG